MKVLSCGIMVTASVLALAACAPRGPKPSQAILEARQRAALADSRPTCLTPGAVLDVPFVYGAADLTDDAKARLDQAVAWSACTARAQILINVDPEYHHRQPEKDKALYTGRQAVLRGYLADRKVAGVVVPEGGAADPARPLLTIHARGW